MTDDHLFTGDPPHPDPAALPTLADQLRDATGAVYHALGDAETADDRRTALLGATDALTEAADALETVAACYDDAPTSESESESVPDRDDAGGGWIDGPFREAVADWMAANRHRFVVPSREHWPPGVDDRDDALLHYSTEAASEILAAWDERAPDDRTTTGERPADIDTTDGRLSLAAAQDSADAHRDATGHELVDLTRLRHYPPLFAVSCHTCGRVVAYVDGQTVDGDTLDATDGGDADA